MQTVYCLLFTCYLLLVTCYLLLAVAGNLAEISAAKLIKINEIAKQAANPYSWKTQPDSTVPIKRPIAFAM